MAIKSIIFDLDGTLIDSIQDITICTNQMLSMHGCENHTVDSYVQWIGHGARDLIEKAVPSDTSVEKIDQMLADYRALYSEHYNVKTYIYKGLDLMLDKLVKKGISFSILTNKPHAETIKITDFYFKKWPFKYIYGQRNGFPKKPNPQLALQIAADLRVKPSECLFIGDSSTDINTANAAGMQTIGVSWGYGSIESMKEVGAEIIANSAKELEELIIKQTK